MNPIGLMGWGSFFLLCWLMLMGLVQLSTFSIVLLVIFFLIGLVSGLVVNATKYSK